MNTSLYTYSSLKKTYHLWLSIILIAITLLIQSCICDNDKETVDYVDPFIGTDYFGHTFPGAVVPFGMIQLSPDHDTKGWTYSSGYSYADSSIMGFSHTHFSGVGMTSGGDILLMPTVADKIQTNPGSKENPDSGYRSRYDKADESATPGYYSVLLKDDHIKAELTTTRRVGMHRYTFPKARRSNILLDLGHEIGNNEKSGYSMLKIAGDSTIEGYKDANGTMVYFVAKFSKPFDYYGTWDSEYKTPESAEGFWPYKDEEKGLNVGAFVSYATKEDEQILVKVAISFVSIEGAKKNLQEELPGWDFDKVKDNARKAWNEELKRVQITTDNEAQKQIFYTAVYRSLLAQYIGQDTDGQYMGMDNKVHTAKGYNFTPNFSCWDTYRSQHPLLTIIAPNHVNDLVKSISAKTTEYGWLPAQHFRNVFGQGMVGDHLVPVIVDAYIKGYRDWDIEGLYNAMKRKASELPTAPLPASAGRSGLTDYLNLGYAPCDVVTESVPNTLELAYNDWCIARLAEALGKKDDAALFYKRARNYRNVFDSTAMFMRPRLKNGTWLPEKGNHEQDTVFVGNHRYYQYFDPLLVGRRPMRHYTESNAWQYLWSVQHDAQGLVNLLGGEEAFHKRLDTFFEMDASISEPKYVGVVGTIGQYVHGNQPSHHVAYLYNYASAPWKTQMRTRQIIQKFYRTGAGGLCGNEDMGSLSSWFVLSSMGIYPVTPGSSQYAIGSPLFEEVEIKVKDNQTFRIIARNNNPKNIYIQSATINGKPFNRCYIDQSEIMAGGELVFEMGATPNKAWGVGKSALPYSLSE
ncbi:GH92 family glycosyl hydrolase [Emticicia sp. BO119]|uniref:GH92 family glycosyl hydrolase n=1 Tax=Emticicia sp. BO119 TaxID=2757768 RepID=UPI0015F03F68|nr:GH92 family glycosyl hydrolase [Emticicia sp. BO119]MBA4848911.1 glycoside hydrolase family 92 protein [Emticicia sp. BO119]